MILKSKRRSCKYVLFTYNFDYPSNIYIFYVLISGNSLLKPNLRYSHIHFWYNLFEGIRDEIGSFKCIIEF